MLQKVVSVILPPYADPPFAEHLKSTPQRLTVKKVKNQNSKSKVKVPRQKAIGNRQKVIVKS
jgi:hypothetical protein